MFMCSEQEMGFISCTHLLEYDYVDYFIKRRVLPALSRAASGRLTKRYIYQPNKQTRWRLCC